MFKGQPKGLYALALANTGERFGYYTMLAIFTLFLQAKFGFTEAMTGTYFSTFLAFVYFLPLVGGILADKFGYGKMVKLGLFVMFLGYVCLAVPTEADSVGLWSMIGALALISIGTGLFKGNLQVMVGNLYDDPKYSAKRDTAFSIFYMAINIGAMFAPAAATKMTDIMMGNDGFIYNGKLPAICHQVMEGSATKENLAILHDQMNAMGTTLTDGAFADAYIHSLSQAYNWGFAIACLSLIVSAAIYFGFRSTFKHVENSEKQAAADNAAQEEELTPQETKQRVTALILVFIVVIFFWMAFHQNGLTLTFFARDYTASEATGATRMLFNIGILTLAVISVYSLFALFDKENTGKAKGIATALLVVCIGSIAAIYGTLDDTINLLPQQFQQFNPFYVVSLTPVSLALFGWLASKGKEPSAPRKIAYGMVIAAVAYCIMVAGSMGMPTPDELKADASSLTNPASPNLLASTYLVLTFAELLLSPMGISFVSKVAPPKLKGLMMGGWFAATAIGNYGVQVASLLWGPLPLIYIWGILLGLCLVAALFMFSMMKRLEKVS